jgi:formiminotetrahydrofolate cyclodeaminase
MGFAGLRGGIWNVLINLKDIADEAFVRAKREACAAHLREAKALLEETTGLVDERLTAMIERPRV